MNKGIWYKHLLEKAENAIMQGYYLETTWIIYSIIDDRIKSALNNLSIPFSPKDMLGVNLSRLGTCSALELSQAGFNIAFLNKIREWADHRNMFMHNLGDEISLRYDLEAQLEAMAKDGLDLAKEVSAFVMRLKKRLK